ncbi:MAG: response regulator transcription factor [Ramlibacter sp.]
MSPADTSVPPIRVVVVEDDPSFCTAFVAAINAAPDLAVAGVARLRSGALALLAEPAADVLLVDLGLPDGSGIDVIRAAQQAWPGCEVVVTTAFADEAHVMQAIEAGASGYLLKDSTPEKIVDEIRSLHRGGSPISPLIARRVLQRLRQPEAPAAAPPGPAAGVLLSARETQVLELVAKGFAYDEIAQRMEVTRHTVLTFVRRIYAKLEVSSKMEAVNEARRKGLLAP